MQSLIQCGRFVSRALINGVYGKNHTDAAAKKRDQQYSPALVTALSGFPKDFTLPVSRLLKGHFGDDACFIARHNIADVVGVADGVGGWRQYGVDPGLFSQSLMAACERLVTSGRFNPHTPAGIIAASYYELAENKQPINGSSTACVVVLHREEQKIYAANIGDSGFLVVRNGEVVHRSQEQQHYFNTPFQLALPPPGSHQNVLSDSPESAHTSEFSVEEGDVILLGSDGVFDNLPDSVLASHIAPLCSECDSTELQKTANSIALQARSLMFDASYLSPFAQSARENGIAAIGGKPDDITVLLAAVVL